MYTRDDDFGWKQSTQFKKAFSVDVKVDFLGAWYVFSVKLLCTELSESDGLFRDTVCSVGVVPHTLPLTDSNSAVRYFRHAIALDECRAAYQVNHWHPGNPHDYKGVADERTNVREVWFAGCHSGMFTCRQHTLPESDITLQTLVEGQS
jgi:uncharacterized protein (DUF2235 family)